MYGFEFAQQEPRYGVEPLETHGEVADETVPSVVQADVSFLVSQQKDAVGLQVGRADDDLVHPADGRRDAVVQDDAAAAAGAGVLSVPHEAGKGGEAQCVSA